VKVIAYSLWGDNPTYTIGAIKNADLAARLFPDWVCVFYCFDSVPTDIISQLQSRSNVVVRMVGGEYNSKDSRGMFHRFLPADEDGVEYMMSRDTDSRLSERERLAVEQWISSGADLHVMRDHPYHGAPMLGGMWGVKGRKLKGIAQAMEEFQPNSDKGQDQSFLWEWVWEKVRDGELTVCVHDPFFQKTDFPQGCTRGNQNGGVWFIGQVFDEHDKYNSQHDVDLIFKVLGAETQQ
jgi:protein O-GlcNAc transferase